MTVDRETLRGQPLTPNEVEVLTAVSFGYANKQIATRMLIAETTVQTYMRQIAAKLGTRSRAHMVRLGFVEGYLRMPTRQPMPPIRGGAR